MEEEDNLTIMSILSETLFKLLQIARDTWKKEWQ